MLLGNRWFDIIAPIYDKFARKLNDSYVLRYLNEGTVLDLGGGTGRVLEGLKGDYFKVVADISKSMLKVAKRKQLNTVMCDARKLPFKDNSIDNIVIVDALHHFPEQENVLKECVRVLKSKGVLIIREPNIDKFPIKFIAFLERILLMRSKFISYPDVLKHLKGGKLEVDFDGLFYNVIFYKD